MTKNVDNLKTLKSIVQGITGIEMSPFIWAIFFSTITFFLTFLLLKLSSVLINKIFALPTVNNNNKTKTLKQITKSLVNYVIYFICGLTLLINLGFNPSPILTGAGIVGVALGFGAQSLVKDFISGFFLIFEGQLEVGDYVRINNEIEGTVEDMGLRITQIREYNQRLHYLPNGSISYVTNYNRENKKSVISFNISFEENIDLAIQTVKNTSQEIVEKYKSFLIEEPQVRSQTNLDLSGVKVTLSTKFNSEKYWKITQELRSECLTSLEKNGIRITNAESSKDTN